MFYSDHEKLIYSAPSGRLYDPLALQRQLIIASNGNLNKELDLWANGGSEPVRCLAEDALVLYARKAFGHKLITEEEGVGDAVVLNDLEDFLRWLEGKDLRGSKPQP